MSGLGSRREAGVRKWLVAGLGCLVALPGTVEAQRGSSSSWLPREAYFDVGGAAVREPRFTIAVIRTDLLAPAAGAPGRPDLGLAEGTDTQVSAALGGTLRLWRPAVWRGGGLITGIQTGVWGRFQLSGSANTLLASDWLVAFPVEARWGPVSGRARFLHWSAHLGDELIEETGEEREDFTFEAIDLVSAYDLGAMRVYGGGALVLRSQLEDAENAPPGFTDRGSLELGADGGWYPWSRGRVGFRGGVDLQWSDRSGWRRQAAGTVALVARGAERSGRIGLLFFDGPSPLGQFYLNDETYWGLEIRIDL